MLGWRVVSAGILRQRVAAGSHRNTEARIDSLAQSWSVIAGGGDPARALTAMESANRELVKDAERVVLLFTPPFDHSEPHPGYIMGYPRASARMAANIRTGRFGWQWRGRGSAMAIRLSDCCN